MAQDGSLEIYANSDGTVPCTNLPAGERTTLYVVATLEGTTSSGIAGAEFRVEVSNPTGYQFAFKASAWAAAYGNPMDIYADIYPADANNGSGAPVVFPCQNPTSGKVVLGTIVVANLAGGGTTLAIKRKRQPTDPSFPCPLFIRCDSSKICVSIPSSQSCGLEKPSATPGDEPVFVAGLNLEPNVIERPSKVVRGLVRENQLPISFFPRADESEIDIDMSREPQEILARIAANGEYRFETINGHKVVYPNTPQYMQVLTLPADLTLIQPQEVVAKGYVEWLRSEVPGFEALLAPPRIGKRRFLEPISLHQGASVLEHFVQLLGSDSTAVLDICPAPSGLPWLAMFRVRQLR